MGKVNNILRLKTKCLFAAVFVWFCLTVGCSSTSGQLEKTVENENGFDSSAAFSQPSGTLAVKDLAIAGDKSIWVVGYDGESPGKIRYSQDGGVTWQAKQLPSEDLPLDSVRFLDPSIGIVSGSGFVFKSTDGGNTFRKVYIGQYLQVSYLSFFGKVGYLAGNYVDKDGEKGLSIWLTEDMGETWRKVFTESGTSVVFDVLAVDERSSLVLVDGNTLMRSTDKGDSWELVQIQETKVRDLARGQDGRIWLACAHEGLKYSMDLGSTRKPADGLSSDLTLTNWNSVSFADSQIGFAVGSKGEIARTVDGGDTWRLADMIKGESLEIVKARPTLVAIMGAERLYTRKL